MTHEQELEGYILQGMARAIWGHAFIQWATNVDPPPEIPANSTWADVTPPTPAGALKAAKDFARGIGELNRLGPTPLTQMFSATRRYVQPRRSATRATEADQAFQFGEDVAQACLGTLELPELGQYKLPEMKAMLDDDGQSLSWDEGWTWHPRIGADRVPNPPGMPLRTFATNVNAELPYIKAGVGNGAKGRFGDRKVFISALWRNLRKAPAFKGMTLPEFKDRLVEAHGQRLLVLARADLVAAMDPEEVAESEWVDPSGGRSYHFVVDQSVS